jgi:hypothetical protein
MGKLRNFLKSIAALFSRADTVPIQEVVISVVVSGEGIDGILDDTDWPQAKS